MRIDTFMLLTMALLLLVRDHAANAADTVPVTGREVPELAPFDEVMLSLLKDNGVPGGALAVARNGKIVYARGFGYADVEKRRPVEPNSLFRIASVSKSVTAAAILQLHERGKFKLEDAAFTWLGFTPHLEPGAQVDPRLARVTIGNLLDHTGGFDRAASPDPMFKPIEIATAFGTKPPATQRQIIEYAMGRPLDFEPGTRMRYSNFGYCVLGRIIEKASGVSYEKYVQQEILAPAGIHYMRLGRTHEEDRAPGEVRYYPHGDRQGLSVFGDGRQVPVAYGSCCVEALDSHGGWLASAPQLVRFASSFDNAEQCPILKPASIARMLARPVEPIEPGMGQDKSLQLDPDTYYACGWFVRSADGKIDTWHSGLFWGATSQMIRRHDGLTWAVLLNRDFAKDNRLLLTFIDPLIHAAADRVKNWPQGEDFKDEKPGDPQ